MLQFQIITHDVLRLLSFCVMFISTTAYTRITSPLTLPSITGYHMKVAAYFFTSNRAIPDTLTITIINNYVAEEMN